MAYRADIEIGVKGARYLDELQNKLTQVSKAIDAVNAKDVVVRRTIAGAASATPMGPGGAGVTSASAIAAATAVENKVRAMRREDTQQGIKAVRDRAVAENYISGIIERRLQTKQKELQLEQKITEQSNKQAAAAFRSKAGNAASSAIIGGGFPLLFGQGAGAAVGGGLGGLAGGLLGGGFGFALSIAGTAIGDAIDQTQTFNRSLAVLNAGTKQYGTTAQITAEDVKTLAKNLNITKEEAIGVLSAFSGFRSAETKNALALLYGTDANTLQDLAAVKDKADLAQVILKSYNKITVETATQLLNQLKTTDSATVELAFQKALLEVEIKKTEEGLRQITIQDRIIAGLASIGSLGAGGPVIDPAVFGQQRVQQFRNQIKNQDPLSNALDALRQLRGATRTAEGFRPDRGADKAARDAAREAERVAEVVRSRRASAEFIRIESGLQDKIAAAENNRDTVLAARLRGEQNILNIQYEYAKSLAAEKNPAAQAAIIYEGMTKLTAARRDTEREINRIYVERQRMMEDMIADLDYEVQLKYATTQEERTRIEIERERARLIKEGITDESLLAAVAARRAELNQPIMGSDLMRQQIGALSDELTKLVDVGTQITAVAENIGSAFANSFKGAVSGAMTAQEALAGFFQSVADRFLDMAAQIIAKWIEMSILNSVLNLFPGGNMGATSSGPVGSRLDLFNLGAAQYRASGGPVSAGSPYIVGERGPELFVPGRSGNIVPNDSLGGDNFNVVVNVDATGSKVQGDGGQANQLAKAVSAAVQQELIKQKRPGGLLG